MTLQVAALLLLAAIVTVCWLGERSRIHPAIVISSLVAVILFAFFAPLFSL